jgi:hypothetical protein
MGMHPPPARADFSIMMECTNVRQNSAIDTLCVLCGPDLSIRGSGCIMNNVLSPNRIKGIRI